jgi:hypothetical protein
MYTTISYLLLRKDTLSDRDGAFFSQSRLVTAWAVLAKVRTSNLATRRARKRNKRRCFVGPQTEKHAIARMVRSIGVDGLIPRTHLN